MPLVSKRFYKNLLNKCSLRRFFLALLIAVASLATLNYIGGKLYIATYRWQVMELADMLRPVKRTKCVIGPVRTPKVAVEATTVKPKIALGSMYADSDSNWEDGLMNRVIRNRVEYCKMHDYEFINANYLIDHTRPVAWSKLIATRELLNKFDYVVYIDMDVIIMEPDVTIETFVDSAPLHADFIMTNDWSGPNTGTIAIMILLSPLIAHRICSNTPYPHIL